MKRGLLHQSTEKVGRAHTATGDRSRSSRSWR